MTAHSSHIVGLVDLSEGGAYLASRAPVLPGQRIALKLLLTLEVAVVLPAEVVRVATRREGPDSYPPGIAIRFLEMEPGLRAALARFVEAGRRRAGL